MVTAVLPEFQKVIGPEFLFTISQMSASSLFLHGFNYQAGNTNVTLSQIPAMGFTYQSTFFQQVYHWTIGRSRCNALSQTLNVFQLPLLSRNYTTLFKIKPN